ncbi:MAG: ATPase [Acidimicrobiaceae bacterium]|nr:ATPase [Acidimicrobiaceae bacterium]
MSGWTASAGAADVLGVDGGNSKTEFLAATIEGELVAYARGPGSNVHAIGAPAAIEVIAELASMADVVDLPARAALFLCGVDVPKDRDEVSAALVSRPLAEVCTIDNDTFALLRAGRRSDDAVAVVCGAGINVVGRNTSGRTIRYPSLGWETGDWGGSEMLGREVIFLAARGEDGRGTPTVLAEAVRRHFGASVEEVGEAVHFRRLPVTRLGELAPAVLAAASDGDSVATQLVARLAREIALMARRGLFDLGLARKQADVVLGGGMLSGGKGPLVDAVRAELADLAPAARPLIASDPPVIGAALAALDAAGATDAAKERLRAAFKLRVAPGTGEAAS